jgi:formylglycine-generating enzyme required for sulfatase activity
LRPTTGYHMTDAAGTIRHTTRLTGTRSSVSIRTIFMPMRSGSAARPGTGTASQPRLNGNTPPGLARLRLGSWEKTQSGVRVRECRRQDGVRADRLCQNLGNPQLQRWLRVHLAGGQFQAQCLWSDDMLGDVWQWTQDCYH